MVVIEVVLRCGYGDRLLLMHTLEDMLRLSGWAPSLEVDINGAGFEVIALKILSICLVGRTRCCHTSPFGQTTLTINRGPLLVAFATHLFFPFLPFSRDTLVRVGSGNSSKGVEGLWLHNGR